MLKRQYEFSWDLIGNVDEGRPNLGNMTRIEVYRLFQYTLRDVLEQRYGAEESNRILYEAGYIAGRHFCQQFVDRSSNLSDYLAQVQRALRVLKVGIMRFEVTDAENEHYVVSVDEDLDCSGLPVLEHEVCNYDEGFLSGIFNAFDGRTMLVKEVNCWCTNDRTCRFDIRPAAKAKTLSE